VSARTPVRGGRRVAALARPVVGRGPPRAARRAAPRGRPGPGRPPPTPAPAAAAPRPHYSRRRNFKLLDELEDAEKGSKAGADISLGLESPDDTLMSVWNASIFGSLGGGDMRLVSLVLVAGPDYPRAPPALRFTSRVAMECVDARGAVLPAKVPYLAAWHAGKTMLGALQEIKALMARAPRAQPPEGASY